MVVAGSIPATGSMSLYYEIHVTIEFPGEEHIETLREFCKPYEFHMGDLLLMKNENEKSHKDLFFTAREEIPTYGTFQGQEFNKHKQYVRAQIRTETFCRALQLMGYKVIRYKIEETLIDSKYNDTLKINLNYKMEVKYGN